MSRQLRLLAYRGTWSWWDCASSDNGELFPSARYILRRLFDAESHQVEFRVPTSNRPQSPDASGWVRRGFLSGILGDFSFRSVNGIIEEYIGLCQNILRFLPASETSVWEVWARPIDN